MMKRDRLVALSLAALVAVVLPLQTYLANAEIYPFSIGRLLPELLALWVALTLPLLALQAFSLSRLRPFVTAFLAAGAVCVYLESGILSAGLPELNGGVVPELSSVPRQLVDVGVWVLVVVSFVAGARWVAPVAHGIALTVLVLAVASLFDVGKSSESQRPQAGDSLASGFENQPTVVANVQYSPARNILVFILDSMPGYAVGEVVRTNAALKARFDGFTAFTYNIGMHECTKRGVPGLVTGHYYDPKEMPETEYPLTMYGTNSFVTAAVQSGWNVSFSPDLMPYGYTNLPVEKRVVRQEKRSRDVLAILRQSTEVPHLSLFDLVAFRLSPFYFKGPILYSRIRHAVKGRHTNDSFWGEKVLYPALATCPPTQDGRPYLGVFHSWGAHPPLEGGFAATVTDKLGHLARLLDAYRANGLYDKSLIIVTTDHGRNDKTEVDGYPDHASALLWVKPEGAKDPFLESDVRTSHAKIAPLVKASLARTLSTSEVTEILRSERRLFRAPVREGLREYFRDWIK